MAYPLFSLSNSHRAQPRLFGVFGVAREALEREFPTIAAACHCAMIDGRSQAICIARSPLLTADLILVLAAPSALDGWEPVNGLRLVERAHAFRPTLIARMQLNHCAARTMFVGDTADALTEYVLTAFPQHFGEHIGRTDSALAAAGPCSAGRRRHVAWHIATVAAEIDELVR